MGVGVAWVVGVGVAGVVVSLPSAASRNSRMPLPSDPNTWGSLPAPNMTSTITNINSSSGGPILIAFLLFERRRRLRAFLGQRCGGYIIPQGIRGRGAGVS